MKTLRGLLLAGLVLAPGMGGAYAEDDDENKIDCSETDLALDAPGYQVTCYDLSDSTVSVGMSFAGAKVAELDANSRAEQTFLVVIDARPLGTIALKRRSLRADVEDYFSKAWFKNWSPGTSVANFEVERFIGIEEGAEELECIGFRRQGARRYSGLARLVVGLACSGQDVEHAYEALKKLDAPGA